MQVRQDQTGLTLEVPKENQDPIDTLIELELDRPAGEVPPVAVISAQSLSGQGAKATASNVYRKISDYAADKAIDGDLETRWATDVGTKQAWLEVDLGATKKIGAWPSANGRASRIGFAQFELQYRNDGEWQVLFQGTTIGEDFQKKFDPVTARAVRLNILEATEGPTIDEFEIGE